MAVWKQELSKFIKQELSPYFKKNAKIGRITSSKDFKFLAKKVCFIF